jgi:porphobilinogen synthase
MGFPLERPRRLRRTPALRRLVRESRLSARQLIHPAFIREGLQSPQPIGSMPGQRHESIDSLCATVEEAIGLGLGGVLLFGLPSVKDAQGSGAFADAGVIQQSIRALRERFGDACVVIADCCLCEYTDHGHCGFLLENGDVDNDATLELYARTAVSQAAAGADIIAPSGMMDGQVGAIREALDMSGFTDTAILGYSAKFATVFYGPFRDAAESTPKVGDRRSYQMDPANQREAVREAILDVEEGADMVMVKPALAYLDVIRAVREEFDVPVAAYNVSGEYSMVKAAVQKGWMEEQRVVLEILAGIQRAGADIILTYHAKEAARWLKE